MTREASLTVEQVGAGTVGNATGAALADWGHDVVFKDVDDSVLEALADAGHRTASPDEVVESDLTLLTVPTPYDEEADEMRLDVVADAFATAARQDPDVLAIRSTVPPGTTERLARSHGIEDYAMVPEFLFAETARQDLEDMDTLVIGSATEHACETVKRAFEPSVTNFVETTPTEAEFVKMSGNTFAATKISFTNEMWRLADFADEADTVPGDVDPDRMLAGLREVSPWFGPEMGMEGGWPYGGHCLPKDTRGLRAWAKNEHSIVVPQLSGTIAENELIASVADEPEPTPTVQSTD